MATTTRRRRTKRSVQKRRGELPAQRLAKVVKEEVAASVHKHRKRRIAVALSGGVDSSSLFIEMVIQGLKPIVVSYSPSTHESTDFKMARAAAKKFDCPFFPARVQMNAKNLERGMRYIIERGYHGKIQVESLVPMVTVLNVAANKAGAEFLFTGDHGGYFANDRTSVITKKVRTQTTSDVIDQIRHDYYTKDMSCSGIVRKLGKELGLVDVVCPLISERLYEAFQGTLWTDVNRPRPKEPFKLAWDEWFNTPKGIPIRPSPINLHKGDSGFGDTMAEMLLALPKFQRFRSPMGLYNAVARGEA